MLRALQPIEHDGRRYAPGDVLRVDAVAAEALLACGAAEAAPSDAAPETATGAAGADDAAAPRARARKGG